MAGERSSLRGFRPHIRMHNASKEFTYENRFNYCAFLLGLLFSVFGPNASEKKGIDGEFRILKDHNALPGRGGGFSVAGVCDTGATSLP